MEVLFHAQHDPMSDRLQRRARQRVNALARRLGHAVDAIVRLDEDGPAHRVEITLHAPRRKSLVATAADRYAGTALSEALLRLEAQVETVRRKRLARRVTRA